MKKTILNLLKNKYILASLAFIVWIGYVDADHNFFRQRQLKKDIQDMLKLKEFYEVQIEANKTLAYKLENDNNFVEQFAREEYGMKKDNEVVYVVVPE